MDTSGERHRGVLTADDMARWQPTVEAPVTLEYGRYTVCKGGPWSQGPVMLQQLALLKRFNLDALDPTERRISSTRWSNAPSSLIADRDKFYGDPNFVEVPLETLLSDAYNAERRKLVGERASLEQRPGTITGFGKQLAVRVPGGARHGGRRRRADRRQDLDARRHDDPGVVTSRTPSSTAPAPCAATPCISTSSTGPATWCRRRRRAAGCNPRR